MQYIWLVKWLVILSGVTPRLNRGLEPARDDTVMSSRGIVYSYRYDLWIIQMYACRTDESKYN